MKSIIHIQNLIILKQNMTTIEISKKVKNIVESYLGPTNDPREDFYRFR